MEHLALGSLHQTGSCSMIKEPVDVDIEKQ